MPDYSIDKKRILLIEPDTLQLKNISTTLSEYYDVSQTKSLSQGIKYLNTKQQPNLIIVNSDLETSNEAVKTIHDIPNCSNLPIVLLGEDFSMEKQEKSLHSGAIDYINRFLPKDILINQISEILSHLERTSPALEQHIQKNNSTTEKQLSQFSDNYELQVYQTTKKLLKASLSTKDFEKIAPLLNNGDTKNRFLHPRQHKLIIETRKKAIQLLQHQQAGRPQNKSKQISPATPVKGMSLQQISKLTDEKKSLHDTKNAQTKQSPNKSRSPFEK